MNATPLDLETLLQAIRERDAAFRVRTRLQPAGGPGEKVFPPTYAGGVYALETRRIDGRDANCVLMSSVAEQANRAEEALRRRWEEDDLPLPMISVDFKGKGLIGLHELTVFDAPHRIADALLRDSFLDGKPFRFSPPGEALTLASNRDVTDLFHWSPSALIFGVWDSTGPRGGLGVKFPRALASEIIAIDIATGVKTSSRIDPAGIEIKAAELYEAAAGPEEEPGRWVLEPSKAKQEKGKPVPVTGGGEKGRPSAVNHGNIAPSVEKQAGGVTMDHALQTSVLSLTALRRLRFPGPFDGEPFDKQQRREAEPAAWAALAALGLAAITFAREEGYFLRSRCHLVPEKSEFLFERIGANGETRGLYSLDADGAQQLLIDAQDAAAAHGLTWREEPVLLEPAEKLVTLIRKSQEIDTQQSGESDDGTA